MQGVKPPFFLSKLNHETKLLEVRHMSNPKFHYLGLPNSVSNAVLSDVCGLPFILLPFLHIEIEVPMTDHLRGFALDLEKYKVVQIFPMYM
jgi:hypothetical protein